MNSEFIYDTTLRDGEQMPGVVFSSEEKIELAKKMSDFGIGIIGLMPAISEQEQEVVKYLSNCGLKSQITAATMMRKKHIDIARDCDVDRIILFTSLSDIHLNKKLKISRKENLEKTIEYVDYANSQGLVVDFAGEDASRANQDYLVEFINALDGKIKYFLPCDTLGILTPQQTYNTIKKLKRGTNCKIGLHNHNDLGQAVANTLAGIAGGADIFSGTFTGIGERAGNAATEEVIMSLKLQYNKTLPLDYSELSEICKLVERYSGVQLQRHKPIAGANAFSHESGIHVDGILKDPINYELFDSREIGRDREFLYGKHSGVCGLKYLFGNEFSSEQYVTILQDIKKKSSEEKRSFNEKEILEIVEGGGYDGV